MFQTENTPQKRAKLNANRHLEAGYLTTIPWEEFFSGTINEGEVKTLLDYAESVITDKPTDTPYSKIEEMFKKLQNKVGVTPDGIIGKQTLKAIQDYMLKNESVVWCPVTGDFIAPIEGSSRKIQYVKYAGLDVPLDLPDYVNLVNFADKDGIDLHSTGSFSNRRGDKINSIVVHWGGLNPEHIARIFLNRKASSHFGVGRSEKDGNVIVYQYIDLVHSAWHAVGANKHSIGIDICQQPETKWASRYPKLKTVKNPTKHGPKEILELDPEVGKACAALIKSLEGTFWLKPMTPELEKVTKEAFVNAGGVYSHWHVDFKNKGKWDIAPWWETLYSYR